MVVVVVGKQYSQYSWRWLSLFGCTQSTEVRALGVCETLTVQEKKKSEDACGGREGSRVWKKDETIVAIRQQLGKSSDDVFLGASAFTTAPRRSSESEKARMSKSERWRGGFWRRHETRDWLTGRRTENSMRRGWCVLLHDVRTCLLMVELADNANDYGGGDGAIVQVNLGPPRSSPLPTCPWPLLPSLAMTRCVLLK